MKKLTGFILACCILLALIPAGAAERPYASGTMQTQVLLSKDGFSVIAVSMAEARLGHDIEIEIINNTDSKLAFSVNRMQIGDVALDISDKVVTSPGKRALDSIRVRDSLFAYVGICEISQIDFYVSVKNEETKETLIDDVITLVLDEPIQMKETNATFIPIWEDDAIQAAIIGTEPQEVHSGDKIITRRLFYFASRTTAQLPYFSPGYSYSNESYAGDYGNIYLCPVIIEQEPNLTYLDHGIFMNDVGSAAEFTFPYRIMYALIREIANGHIIVTLNADGSIGKVQSNLQPGRDYERYLKDAGIEAPNQPAQE